MLWRVGARFVDVVVIGWVAAFAIVEIFGRLLGGDPLGRESASSQIAGMSTARTQVALAVVLVLYEVLPVALKGATLGKAMLGLRVVSLDSFGHPGVLSATLRAIVLYGPLAIPYIGLLLLVVIVVPVFIWPTRRGVHDVVAGTAVIQLDRGLDRDDP